MQGVLGQVELVREAATLVMLVTVGMLAGRTRRAQAGYAAIAFGVWDIFYYLFLRIIGGWPRSLFDWDILFLLPLPWWGPVLAPVSIALLMIIEGTLESRREVSDGSPSVERRLGRLQGLGILLALYVFMADALSALHHGLDAQHGAPGNVRLAIVLHGLLVDGGAADAVGMAAASSPRVPADPGIRGTLEFEQILNGCLSLRGGGRYR